MYRFRRESITVRTDVFCGPPCAYTALCPIINFRVDHTRRRAYRSEHEKDFGTRNADARTPLSGRNGNVRMKRKCVCVRFRCARSDDADAIGRPDTLYDTFLYNIWYTIIKTINNEKKIGI